MPFFFRKSTCAKQGLPMGCSPLAGTLRLRQHPHQPKQNRGQPKCLRSEALLPLAPLARSYRSLLVYPLARWRRAFRARSSSVSKLICKHLLLQGAVRLDRAPLTFRICQYLLTGRSFPLGERSWRHMYIPGGCSPPVGDLVRHFFGIASGSVLPLNLPCTRRCAILK